MNRKSVVMEAGIGSARSHRSARILIVEDSPVQAELLRRDLEGAGYKVFVAGDGAKGLVMAKANRPDAVVSDINMPAMDGYELCHAIRDDEVLKDTPVILLTMLSDPQEVIRGLNAGVDGYVTKPYIVPTLVSRVESLLAQPLIPSPPVERRKAEIRLAGESHLVDAQSPRILNLLISTYENAVLQNRELAATQQALEGLNRQLKRSGVEQTAALRDSEQRFRKIVEDGPDLVVVIDARGAIVYVSPSIKRLGGYDIHEVLGPHFLEFTHPEDRANAAADIAEVVGSPDKWRVTELRFRHKNNTWITLESIERNALADPAINGIVMNLRDITERKLAEEALARKERYYRKLIEGGADVFFLADPAGILLYCSDSGKRLTGWETAEVLGKPITNFVLQESLPLARKAMAETLENPARSIKAELRLLCKDGTQVEVEALGRNLLGDPDIGGIVVTARDISERKRAQEALVASESRFRLLIENASDLVIVLDAGGILRYVSPSAQPLLGYAPEEVLSRNMLEFIHPDDGAAARATVAKAVAEPGVVQALSLRVLHQNGNWRHFEAVGRSLLHEPAVAGIVLNLRDITERKHDEVTIRKVNRALKALGNCNMALVHASDEGQLLNEICRIIVDVSGYRLAWVGFAEHDPQKTVRPMAHAGYRDDYMERAKITWNETASGQGPAGTAIRTRKPQIVYDARTDPKYELWRENAIKLGYGSVLGLPLHSVGKILGALCIYSAERNGFDTEEVHLLMELADDLAFGIVTLRVRAEQLAGEERLRRSMEMTIQVIGSTVEMRDAYTAGHQVRVAKLATAIAGELGMAKDEIHGIHLASVIHDLGKIQIPAEILSKPGRLTKLEYEMIKVHSQAGYDILKDVDFPWPISQIVYQHHERLDGSGYPLGLKGNQILLESRILAVADVVEAMSSHRPYRPALGVDAALAEITKNRGKLYDPAAVDACVQLFRDKEFAFST